MASSDFVMDLFCWWKSNVGYKKKATWLMLMRLKQHCIIMSQYRVV